VIESQPTQPATPRLPWNEQSAHLSARFEMPSGDEVRFVLKPDRRQVTDRRIARGGGRRKSDDRG